MWVVQFQVRCEGVRSDLSQSAASDAACRVESALSVALLELCGHVAVEAVTVEIEEEADDERQVCLRLVHATPLTRELGVDDAN